jgi:hypothetical protein
VCCSQFFLWLFRQLVIMGALYIFGAVLYALRLPERLSPGHFDFVVRNAMSCPLAL